MTAGYLAPGLIWNATLVFARFLIFFQSIMALGRSATRQEDSSIISDGRSPYGSAQYLQKVMEG
jgi:hypothetical protein